MLSPPCRLTLSAGTDCHTQPHPEQDTWVSPSNLPQCSFPRATTATHGDSGDFSLQRQKRTEKNRRKPTERCAASRPMGKRPVSTPGAEHQARREGTKPGGRGGDFQQAMQGEGNSPLATPQEAAKPWDGLSLGSGTGQSSALSCPGCGTQPLLGQQH